MSVSNNTFLTQVTSYIRSKEVKVYVEKELAHHLDATTAALMKSGLSKEEAKRQAIEQMGSAAQIGKSMNKLYKPKWDIWLVGAVLLLLAASFLPIMSTDYTLQFGRDLTDQFLFKQIVYILLAVIVIVALTFVDFRKLWRYRLALYGFGLAILLLINRASNAAYNGEIVFQIGSVNITAWSALPFFVVALAALFATKRFKLWQLIALVIVTFPMFITIPNWSVALLYCCIVAVLFTTSHFTRTTKRVVWGIVCAGITALFVYLYYIYNHTAQSYQLARIHAFLHPELYEGDYGYDIITLNGIMYEAGWFGKETITPFFGAHTDYALVQIVQAYGYSVALIIIVVILAICSRIFWMTRTLPASFGKNIVLGSMTLYSVQSLYSILMVLGVVPIVEMPLPFISYGLTPLLLNAMLIGFVMSVYRRKAFIITTQKASV